MPMSPLPNFAGGRPCDVPASASGASADSSVPLPTSAPPATPAFLRKLRRVSPETASAASATAPSQSISARFISLLIVSPIGGSQERPQLFPAAATIVLCHYGASGDPDHRDRRSDERRGTARARRPWG